ncbi:MAG: metal ABC transporter substrate-binding protein [Patescibacteria group bacterium]
MKKKVIVFILIIIAALWSAWSLAGYYRERGSQDPSDKLKVIATLFPLYDMAKNIGGERVEVYQLLPPGLEAHSFEPKPSDIVRINEADVFVYTGRYMETWAEDIINGLASRDIKIIDTSRGVELAQADSGDGYEEELEHGSELGDESGHHHDEAADQEDGHRHGGVDPHIWLDFSKAQIMVDNIAAALAEKDPANAEFYQNNALIYKDKLTAIDDDYRESLAGCRSRMVVYGGHYAFGYLSRRYGLEYAAAQGISPDAEPTASDLVSLVKQVREDDIKYIFYEELASPKIAETIARETDAKMLLLSAAHNLAKDQFDAGMSFFDVLNRNLDNLKLGLGCE